MAEYSWTEIPDSVSEFNGLDVGCVTQEDGSTPSGYKSFKYNYSQLYPYSKKGDLLVCESYGTPFDGSFTVTNLSSSEVVGDILAVNPSTSSGWEGISVLPSTNGGTGIDNGASTIQLGGNLTTSGSNPLTLTTTGTTNVTLPTSGTLATTSQLPLVESGTISAAQINTLNASPVLLIAAPGANSAIQIISISALYTYGGVSFVGSAAQTISVTYGTGTGTVALTGMFGIGTMTGTANATCLAPPASLSNRLATALINVGVYLKQTVATELTSGNGTIKYYIQYYIINF